MNTLRFEGDMTVYEAAAQYAQLREALEQGGELALDLSAVTALDTAGLQLLVFARKAGASCLAGASAAVGDALSLLQLDAWMAQP